MSSPARRRILTAGVALALAAGLAACTGSDDSPGPAASPGAPPVTASARPTQDATSPTRPTAPPGRVHVVRTLTTGLAVPWGVGFLPDGRAVVTERDSGRVLVVDPRTGKATPIGTIEMAAPQVEAGLLGVAVSPTFDDDHLLYFYVSTPEDNRIVRATWDGGLVGEPQTILDGIPLGPIHDGGRLAFGPDGFLYASTGETGDRDLAQDKSSLAGKILRITPDGKPAPGNPFGDSPVNSYGHRNVQGLAWDDQGRLWASEFGDSTFDELNLVQPGRNYGWPLVEGRGDDPAYTNPKVVWSTDDASPIMTEPFTQWVLEDAFTAGRPPLASLRGPGRVRSSAPRPLLGRAIAAQHVRQGVVGLVAGELVDRPLGAGHRQLALPRPCERRRVVDLELVQQRVPVEQAESLDQMELVVPPEVAAGFAVVAASVLEVRRVHDQRAALPPADRMAQPLAHARWRVRPSVEVHDAGIVNHLGVDDNDIPGHHNLIVAVV